MSIKKYIHFLNIKKQYPVWGTVFVFLALLSCNKKEEVPSPGQRYISNNSQAGVAITFDDDYVKEWYAVNSILKTYDWKATFFVCEFNKLSLKELNELKSLKQHGHEIGGHGWVHLKAAPFEESHGEVNYLDKEIFPMLTRMKEKSFPVHSFAYPYGSRDAVTDTILLHEFNIIRGTTYGKEPPAEQKCYFDDESRVLFGLGIDNNYPQFSIPYFLSLLDYAKKHNKIVVFYAHKPVLKAKSKYETEYKTLIAICKYVKEHQMKFYTVSELYLKERHKDKIGFGY